MGVQGAARVKELQGMFPDVDWNGILEECGEGSLLACGNYMENECFHPSKMFCPDGYEMDF